MKRSHNPLIRRLLLLLVALISARAVAQENTAAVNPIVYNTTVEETITTAAAFDWWQVQALAGDILRVQMIGADGLAPLLGILAPNGDRVATSAEGRANGIVTLEFTAPEDGLYTLVATRAGETTGSYHLTLQRLNDAAPASADEVVFMCSGVEMAVLASIRFIQDEESLGAYPIYVYGLDGLLPAIRVQSAQQELDICHRNAQHQAGDVITLPGGETFTLDADHLDAASQLTVNTTSAELGTITVTFGAQTDTPGRFLAIVGGFAIDPSGDTDTIQVRSGALVNREAALQVYMIGAGLNSRLDPTVRFADSDVGCDDAGRRACANVPPVSGAGVTFNTGSSLIGDRFDAGLTIEAGMRGWNTLELTSFSGNTSGDYALLVVGALPPRPLAGQPDTTPEATPEAEPEAALTAPTATPEMGS